MSGADQPVGQGPDDAPRPPAGPSGPPAVPPSVPPPGSGTIPEQQAPTGLRAVDWEKVGRRAVLWLVLAIVALLVVLMMAAFVPRWWAQQAGNLVDGRFSLGVWWGLFFGAVFTALPVAVAWQAVRPRRSWQVRVATGVVALLLATPNLLTLAVVLGTNNAAHAGERILDVQAPGFRGATAWGAVVGVVVAVGLMLLWSGYRRRGRRLRAIEEASRSGGATPER